MTLIRRARTTFSGSGLVGPGVSTTYWTAAFAATTIRQKLGVFWGAVDTFMSGDVTWTVDPVVDTIDDATGQIVGVATDGTVHSASGVAAGEILNRATQALIHWRTGVFVAGKEVRGRTFIPGMTQDDNNSGEPSALLVQDVGAAADTLRGTSGFRVFSPTHLTSAEVNASSVWSKFAVLRSRRD